MKIFRAIIILVMFTMLGINSNAADTDDAKDPVYKSWKYYKKASTEYNNGNYEKALEYVQMSLSFKRNKKNKKLEQQIRGQGYKELETGTALIHFNPELAKQYLAKAKILIDPTDKRSHTKIDESLRSLEAAQ